VLKDLALSDADMLAAANALQEQLTVACLELRHDALPAAVDVYAQFNQLEGRGARALCEVLEEVRGMGLAYTRVLKLHHNRLPDAAAEPIARLLRAHVQHPEYRGGPAVVQELHLSHNRLSPLGLRAICDAVTASRAYPFQAHDRSRVPLWVRAEQAPPRPLAPAPRPPASARRALSVRGGCPQNPAGRLRAVVGDAALVCDAQGQTCGPRRCGRKPVPPFHCQVE